MLKIPCRHAVAAATVRGLDFRTLVGEMHKKVRWTDIVGGVIFPAQDPKEVVTPEEIISRNVMPLKTRQPPGRPPKDRIPSGGENPVSLMKYQLICCVKSIA